MSIPAANYCSSSSAASEENSSPPRFSPLILVFFSESANLTSPGERWLPGYKGREDPRWVLEPWLKKKMKVKKDEWGPLTACSLNTDILNADMCARTEIICLAEMLIYIFPLMSNPPTISHSEMACIKRSTPSPHPQYSFHPTWHLTWCNVWMDERISLAADVILKCSHDLPY